MTRENTDGVRTYLGENIVRLEVGKRKISGIRDGYSQRTNGIVRGKVANENFVLPSGEVGIDDHDLDMQKILAAVKRAKGI